MKARSRQRCAIYQTMVLPAERLPKEHLPVSVRNTFLHCIDNVNDQVSLQRAVSAPLVNDSHDGLTEGLEMDSLKPVLPQEVIRNLLDQPIGDYTDQDPAEPRRFATAE